MIQTNQLLSGRTLSNPDPAKFEAEIQEGLRLAPFSAQVLNYCGWGYVFLGQPQFALDCFRKLEIIGRFSPFTVAARGGEVNACVQMGRDEKAVELARNLIALAPEYPTPYRGLASALGHLGRSAEAAEVVTQILKMSPGENLNEIKRRSRYVINDAT